MNRIIAGKVEERSKRHTTCMNQRRERANPSGGRVYNKVYNNL